MKPEIRMKMRLISSVIAGAALFVVQAQANLLQNASFEQPASGSKIWTGFSSTTQPDVPAWFTPGDQQAVDSGVENPG